MKKNDLPIHQAYLFEPHMHIDERGSFCELSRSDMFKSWGIDFQSIQENQSFSHQGVLRGLHFQHEPYAQAKCVQVTEGCIYDVIVDLRKHSPTFLKHIALELTGACPKILYIPKGCAHGFLTLSHHAVVRYSVDAYYEPNAQETLLYHDPHLNIQWPVLSKLIVSDKDANGKTLEELMHTK